MFSYLKVHYYLQNKDSDVLNSETFDEKKKKSRRMTKFEISQTYITKSKNSSLKKERYVYMYHRI